MAQVVSNRRSWGTARIPDTLWCHDTDIVGTLWLRNSDMLQFPVIEILCACFVSIVVIRFGAKGAALGMAILTIVLLKLHMHGRGMFILQNAGNNFFVLKNMAQQAGGSALSRDTYVGS
jgi:hypothetical protein